VTLGTVAELFIYPVKSMAGVSFAEAHVGLDGIIGDRQYAFVQTEQAARNNFPWMTGRQSSEMLRYQAVFAHAPMPENREPAVTVRAPHGRVLAPADPELAAELTALGHPVFALRSTRGMFDCQHVSLFSLATVRGLAEESGSTIDRLQFRANVYFEPASAKPFEEETWTSCLIRIGDAMLGVVQRDTRCMMVNLNPETGEQDPRVLRTIAQRHQRQAGLYANVVRPGAIRVGDRIERVTAV
jgi:uncharacterized protein